MCPFHTHGIQETINHALKRALMEQNLLGAAADVIALDGVHLTVSLFSFSLKKIKKSLSSSNQFASEE